MPSLRQLRFLVALADTLNFSRAAEACHVTQSTISTGLKELELELGVQLAERTRHSVLMTPVGEEIARRAQSVLADVEAIQELADTHAGRGTSVVRLGAIPTVGPFIIPAALALIREARPDVRLLLREDLTDALIARLMKGELDAVVMALPYDVPGELEVEPLFDDGYQLATPRGHPLANRPSADGGDLEGRSLLLLEKGHCLQRHALSSFPSAGLSEDGSFAATSLATLAAMVGQGLGLTLLPKLAVAAGAADGHGIALTDLPGARPRRVVLVRRRTSAREDVFEVVRRCLVEARDALFAGADPEAIATGEPAAR
ncbi:LysR substrate-binding domain-containing protein [Acuticoccus mangrovi]|uniref:LysR family transcriptional regulator n=1 Tax=Acuticoccus mangrovi TaxID=2796142 RepID=A0A934IJ14_9HYPH|nr:LysR substrate-binding domain-containing protein [Acuticoccus mangrovi]MBJ3775891.1 LysR family transcriptional regulator [Acuticoccus mangrovi]